MIAGRYRIVRPLGMGGMGAVYEAEQLGLGRSVAVKVLLPQLSTGRDLVARFEREARSAAQISHPGIVQVFDLGTTDDSHPFLVMEKLEGEELGSRIRRSHPLPVPWVLGMGLELCDAIDAAHQRGVVHRDLKPPNVFLAQQGRRHDLVKVLDFGIAKLMQGADEIRTRTGEVFGTPMYMAPEQLRDSKDVDGRVDVYAIGCILYEALTGKPPFEANTYPDLLLRICSQARPLVHDLRSDVSRELSQVIASAMAIDASHRPSSPAALGHKLSEQVSSKGGDAFGSAQTAHALAAAPTARAEVPATAASRPNLDSLARVLGEHFNHTPIRIAPGFGTVLFDVAVGDSPATMAFDASASRLCLFPDRIGELGLETIQGPDGAFARAKVAIAGWPFAFSVSRRGEEVIPVDAALGAAGARIAHGVMGNLSGLALLDFSRNAAYVPRGATETTLLVRTLQELGYSSAPLRQADGSDRLIATSDGRPLCFALSTLNAGFALRESAATRLNAHRRPDGKVMLDVAVSGNDAQPKRNTIEIKGIPFVVDDEAVGSAAQEVDGFLGTSFFTAIAQFRPIYDLIAGFLWFKHPT